MHSDAHGVAWSRQSFAPRFPSASGKSSSPALCSDGCSPCPYGPAIAWLENVASQLGRIHLLLAAEEEYLALAVKRCKKLYHSGMVDKHAFMTASRFANQVFAKDDMPHDISRDSNDLIDMHEIIIAREAADTVEKLINMSHYD